MRIERVDGGRKASVLRALQRQALPEDKPVATHAGWWWLAFDGKEPVAFAGLSPSSQWHATGYLCRAGVLESHRGKGLQKRLIQVRAAHARRLGWQWLVTDTRRNPASANSLIACGFRMYEPSNPWSFRDAVYWRLRLA